MTDEIQEEAPTEGRSARDRWLMLAAVAVIAVPVFIGFLLMRSSDSTSSVDVGGAVESSSGGMGDSGMGDTGMGAASADTESAQGVLDFAQIQATDIRIDLDPDTGSAILNVDTSIDVACAVVYGPTTALGSLSTDTDMAGGAHANHHPRMIGLSAGTVWYRLQGIAADGAFYQSELMELTFPEGGGGSPSVQPPLPNLSDMASIADVSSEYSDAFAARNAIDGDLSTEWSSAGDGDDSYIVLDFGENMHFRGVGFRTREMSDGTSITTSFTVTVGGRTFGPFDAGPGLAIGLFDASGEDIRVDVETSTGGNTGAVEIEVYAEPEM